MAGEDGVKRVSIHIWNFIENSEESGSSSSWNINMVYFQFRKEFLRGQLVRSDFDSSSRAQLHVYITWCNCMEPPDW